MNKVYLLGSVVIGSFMSLKAQPTLTSANTNPQVGESFKVNSTNYVSPGNAGANVTWNFANLTAISNDAITYINSSATPFAANFPQANLAMQSQQNYAYYTTNSTSFLLAGITNSTTLIPYSDPEKLLAFPFTFNSTYTDNFSASYTSNTVPMQRSGTVKVTADGYGTLILPFGTLNNVLRVQVVENYQDSMSDVPALVYIDTVYEWFLPGVHYPVMNLANLYINGAQAITSGSYLDKSSIGINDFSDYDVRLSIFPNPATSYAKIEYSLTSSELVKISLTNVLGQTVIAPVNHKQTAGDYNYSLDLKSVAKGVYLVRLDIGTHVATRKLIVE